MPNFFRTISYEPYARVNTTYRRVFWIGVASCALFVGIYVYSVYLTVELSYKIDSELQYLKEDTALYQQTEQQYVFKLESLQDSGKKALGLIAPARQTFIDRRSTVAKVEM